MSYLHSNWRDCQAWKDEGLPLSTSCNEAAKLYDAVITQYTGWYDDASVGGIENSCVKMLEADPNFVMGHVVANGLDLICSGKGIHTDNNLKSGMGKLYDIASKASITPRERLHVSAVKEWAEGNTAGACLIWEDILVDHPTDMFAIKMAHDSYFYLGYKPQMRDSIARVMSKWKENMPLYWYLNGMYAFGLIETNFYNDAEKHALKGLEMNPRDCWATHAQAHVLEMMGRQDDGIKFMSTTLSDWTMGPYLACHNFWHWAVYHIEKNEHEAALDIYDQEVGERCKSGAMLDLVDASSLLYRLQMEGIEVGDRWRELFNLWASHTDDHILAFNDAHFLMCSLGAKNQNATMELMNSLRKYVGEGIGTNCDVSREVGLAICEALAEADKGNFDKAVEILKPIRYKIVKIGGSDAQRDLFNLFLIHAALHSSNPEHHKYVRALLTERKCRKEHAPMTDRLMARAMALHVD